MENRIGKCRISVFCLGVILFSIIGIFLHLEMIFGQKKTFFGLAFHVPKLSAAVVSSGSMSPVLEVGDLVFIIESDTYQPGDIVEISGNDDVHILHRLVIYNTYADIALTRGDANTMADDPVRCSAIQGKLWFSLPYVGTLVNFFKSFSGHLILTLMSLMLCLSVLRTVLRQKNDPIRCAVSASAIGAALEHEEKITKNNGKGKMKRIVMMAAVLLILIATVFSCSRISALWRSGCSGTFSLQAGSSTTEEETVGMDVVYWQLD